MAYSESKEDMRIFRRKTAKKKKKNRKRSQILLNTLMFEEPCDTSGF
jgi:hypothetical protein